MMNVARELDKKKFLLICNDVIGKQMAGPAIRCVEMAKALSQHHDVVVTAPKVGINDFSGFRLLTASTATVKAEAERADVIVIQGDALTAYPFLKEVKGTLVADLYCPIPLEYHQSSVGVASDVQMNTAIYISRLVADQLCFADHFLCASERQRDFWLGSLAVAGRVNGLRWPKASHANIDELISVVPFGLPEDAPEKNGIGLRDRFGIPLEDFVMIWGGGVYQWFDPLTIIRAIHRLVAIGHRVHLVFMGIKHPNPGIHQHNMCAEAISLADELGLTNNFVHFNFGWVDYECRQNYFLEADAGVSAHFENPETRFSFRTRMLDYLWCGLPILATKGDFFGEAIKNYQLGIVVNSQDIDGWVDAITLVKSNKELHGRFKFNVAKYALNFTWTSIMGSFVDEVGRMGVAADRDVIRTNFKKETIRRGILFKLRQAYSEGGAARVLRLTVRRISRGL